MRKKSNFNSFILACTSLILSNSHAMEDKLYVDGSSFVITPIPNTLRGILCIPESYTPPHLHSEIIKSEIHCKVENDWEVKTSEGIYICPHKYLKSISFSPISKTGFLYNVFAGKLWNESFFIRFGWNSTREDFNSKKEMITNTLMLNNFLFTDIWGAYGTTCSTPKEASRFLSVFYLQDLFPDFIADHIATHLGIEDFKINVNSMIECINEQMTEESTNEDFRRIALGELDKIQNATRRAEIAWDIVQEMMTPSVQEPTDSTSTQGTQNTTTVDRQLILDLCALITDKTLSFYGEAKKMSAELVFSEDSPEKVTITERYKQPLLTLLKISNITEDKSTLNGFVKAFVNNDKPASSLPEELKDLTASPESIFNLLDFIRLQQQELNELRRKK